MRTRLADWPAEDLADLGRLLNRFVAGIIAEQPRRSDAPTPHAPSPAEKEPE